jgi:hypothetical protein
MLLLLYWETCYRDPVTQHVPRQEYIELHIRVSKALISPFVHASALAMALTEWEHDVQGAHAMNEDQFLQAMFSTVDLWYATECIVSVYGTPHCLSIGNYSNTIRT